MIPFLFGNGVPAAGAPDLKTNFRRGYNKNMKPVYETA